MRRIISLDYLRGLAIFGMLIVHTWMNVYDMSTLNNLNLETVNIFVLILAGILFILGHFRSLFLLISSVIHSFSIINKVKRGQDPKQVLIAQIQTGLLLYLFGIIREGIFNPWGILEGLHMDHVIKWDELRFAYLFETLNMIGIGIVFLGIANYFLTRNGGWKKIKRNILIYGALATVIIFISPIIHQLVDSLFGFNFDGNYKTFTGKPGEYFTRFFWVMIAGQEEPIFPFLGTVFIGGMIGTFLAQEAPQKRHIMYGFIASLLLIAGGIAHWVFIDKMDFDIWFKIHPTWFFLLNAGIQTLIIWLFLYFNEFNPKTDKAKFLKHTRYFRRWSLISMTIYFYQIIDIFPRDIFTWITGIDFHHRGQTTLGWTIFMIAIIVIYWESIIRLWELGNFIGTWEYIFVKLNQKLAGKAQISDDRLKVRESLYECDPILFLGKTPPLTLNSINLEQ